jgi:hypothetical protein
MGLVSKWVMPDGRGVVDDGCDASLVELSHLLWAELSQSPKSDIDLRGSFNGLLYVFLPPKLMIEDYPQELGRRRWLDSIAIHGKLALALFFPLPGNVNEFGLFRSEAGPSSPGPGFDPGYVFGLDFGQVLFSAPANAPAEVVIDEGRCPTVKIDCLVDQIAVEEAKRIGDSGEPCASPALSSGTTSVW